MTGSQLRLLSYIACFAALVGVVLCALAIMGQTSLAGGSSVTLIGIVLFFFLRHSANRDIR